MVPPRYFVSDTGVNCGGKCDVIWKREMLSGAYLPSWVKVNTHNGKVIEALTFVINRKHPSFATPLSDKESVKIIAEARGIVGSNSEYLFKTEKALKAEGIKDHKLRKLSALVRQYHNS